MTARKVRAQIDVDDAIRQLLAAGIIRRSPENSAIGYLDIPAQQQEPTNRSISCPSELATPEFKAAWAVWVAHRLEIKKPMGRAQVTTMLSQLATWGVTRSVAAIEYTVAKGWQGLQEPPGGSDGASQGKSVLKEWINGD